MKLFVYEHCPYCIRPRVVMGYKDIDCDIEYLLSDDIAGHTDKIGAKQVPILQKPDGSYMPESLDIVDYLDNLDGKPIFKATGGRADITEVFTQMSVQYRTLIFSYLAYANFGEFKTESARAHFIERYGNHINVESVEVAVSAREEHKSFVENTFTQMENLIHSPEHISEGGLSMDDVIYFADLHRMSVVPDLKLPTKLAEYMECQLSKNKCHIVYDV